MIHQDTPSYNHILYQPSSQGDSEGGLFVDFLGVFESHGGFHYRQRTEVSALHFVEEGQGVLSFNGRTFPVRKGDLFILRKGDFYEYYDHPSSPWKYTYFLLDGPLAEPMLDRIGLDTRSVVHIPSGSRFKTELNRIRFAFEQNRICGIGAVSAGWTLVETLKEVLNPAEKGHPTNPAETAKRLIDQSPHCVTHMDDLVQILGISRATLFRKFTTRYGLSVKQYIEHVRFRRIEELLRNTKLPLGEIARISGFNDPLYFSRAFKKRRGVSPSSWRREQETLALDKFWAF